MKNRGPRNGPNVTPRSRDAANIILDLMQGAPVSIAYNIIGNITVSVFTAGRSSNPAPPWRSSIIRRRTRAR